MSTSTASGETTGGPFPAERELGLLAEANDTSTRAPLPTKQAAAAHGIKATKALHALLGWRCSTQ